MGPVTIIGAGIIGSSIAWRLGQAGARVSLYDAGRMGGEASWAAAGMLAPGGEFTEHSWWTQMAIESLALYPSFVEELKDESGVSIDYRACGAYEIPGSPERAARQRSLGIECNIHPDGRIHYPNDAIVNPRDIVAALRCACLRRGVNIFENSHRSSIEIGEHPVVLAAGAWSNQIQVVHHGSLLALPEAFPVKGHLLGFPMTIGSLDSILRSGRVYVLQRWNGFTIAGSNEEEAGFDRIVDFRVCAGIHQRAAELWPPLEDRDPSAAWIGFRPASRSGAPIIGRHEKTNLWLAYGHYRNGILMAPATARRITSEIL